MSVVHASAITVRHAIARALATFNRSPAEATWRVISARAAVDARGRIARADVSIRVEEPVETLDTQAVGLVNPTGAHPLMALVPGTRTLMDVFPVCWDRWLRVRPGPLPASADAWTVRNGLEHADAAAWAKQANKRLPSPTELRSAWGPGRFPWGEAAAPTSGLSAPPRYEEIPEVGLFPPNKAGFYDLGAWLWQWTDEATLLGGAPGLVHGPPEARPVGFRCAVDLA